MCELKYRSYHVHLIKATPVDFVGQRKMHFAWADLQKISKVSTLLMLEVTMHSYGFDSKQDMTTITASYNGL